VQLHLRRQVRQPDVVPLEQRQDGVDLVSNKIFFFFVKRSSLLGVIVSDKVQAGTTIGGSITVPLTSCLTGLD
jgi:hypothetical protein